MKIIADRQSPCIIPINVINAELNIHPPHALFINTLFVGIYAVDVILRAVAILEI